MEIRKLHPEFFVCQVADVPANILRREDGWRKTAFRFFAVSTYNTDYVLVKRKAIPRRWRFPPGWDMPSQINDLRRGLTAGAGSGIIESMKSMP